MKSKKQTSKQKSKKPKEKKFKILAAGDFHGDSDTAKRLAKKPKFKGTKPMFLPVTSDGKIFIQNGFLGLYLLSIESYGYVKHYHQMSDTIDNINFKNLNLARDFVKELIFELDKEV